LILRPATLGDAAFLLRLRNDPETRANSFNDAEVTEEGHLIWLARSLESPDRQLYVAEVDGIPVGTILAEVDGIPVGTIRADKGTGATELSWTVAPEHRGKRHGSTMLKVLKSRIPGGLVAHIKPSNAASRSMAVGAGFRLYRLRDGAYEYRWPH
jgi:RimJ/RimL family protein N-acetyltransferase